MLFVFGVRMPIADAKVEKQTSPEAAEPIKQAIIIIEHKVRNLEKRKVQFMIYIHTYDIQLAY